MWRQKFRCLTVWKILNHPLAFRVSRVLATSYNPSFIHYSSFKKWVGDSSTLKLGFDLTPYPVILGIGVSAVFEAVVGKVVLGGFEIVIALIVARRLEQLLTRWFEDYNRLKTHQALGGLPP
jgi:hypothetical protein